MVLLGVVSALSMTLSPERRLPTRPCIGQFMTDGIPGHDRLVPGMSSVMGDTTAHAVAEQRRRRLLRDDEHRFVGIYERCARPITAFCLRRVDSDRVDDAVAETFLVAWRRIDNVPRGRDELLWLYRVAGNVVRHEWRASARRRRLGNRMAALRPVGDDDPADRAIANAEHDAVAAALERLDADDAELLMLVAWERLKPAALATVLGVSPNTASQRASRARRRLASAMNDGDATRWREPSGRKGAAQ
jgi:RNA polymerase sigma-70 factor (ECF subfamily)